MTITRSDIGLQVSTPPGKRTKKPRSLGGSFPSNKRKVGKALKRRKKR